MAILVSSAEAHETYISESHDCQRKGQEGTFHGEGKSAFHRTQIQEDFADKFYIYVK